MDLNDMNSFAKLNEQMTKALQPFSSLGDDSIGIGSSLSELIKIQEEQRSLALKSLSSTSLLQEYSKSFTDINEQMTELLQPFSSLQNDSIGIGSSLLELIKIQEEQRSLTLKSLFTTSLSQEYSNSFTDINERMTKLLQPFSSLQNDSIGIGSSLSELIKIQSQSKSITSILDSFGSLYKSIDGSTYLDSFNTTLEKLDFSSLSITEMMEKDFETQIEFLLPEKKKVFDEIITAVMNISPELKNMQVAYKEKKYVQLFTYSIVYICIVMMFLNQLYSLIFTPIPLYKINRDNVRIRTEPSTKNSSSIISKLNKNVVVIKVDSQKNWLKIEFENDQGEIVEGWVRNDMLTKIEQQ